MLSLTQRVHWGRPSAALEGWVFVCSTFPSRTPLAWRPPPVCRTRSCRGRSHQSSDTQWSSCSERFGLRDTEGGRWLMFDSVKKKLFHCFVFFLLKDHSKQTQDLYLCLFVYCEQECVPIIYSGKEKSLWVSRMKHTVCVCLFVCCAPLSTELSTHVRHTVTVSERGLPPC